MILAVVFRNMAVLKVEPHRIVSRLSDRAVNTELRAGDGLAFDGQQLYVVRLDGAREHVRINTALIRISDWIECKAAVERRWPTQPKQ